MCLTIKEPKSKCLKKCSLDPKTQGFGGTPSPPPHQKRKHHFTVSSTNSSKLLVTGIFIPYLKKIGQTMRNLECGRYTYSIHPSIFIVLKDHLTGVLGTRIGGQGAHRQGAGSYHDSYQWTFIFVCYLSTNTNYGIVLIIQIRLRNFAG